MSTDTDIGTASPPDVGESTAPLESVDTSESVRPPDTAHVPFDGGPPVESPSPDAGARRRRWPWVVLVLLFIGLVVGLAVGSGTVAYADSYDGRLLAGTRIAGVDVSGMTPDQAVAAVRAHLAPDLDRKVLVRWQDQRWRTTVRRLGGRADVEAVVADVAQQHSGMTWEDWARLRWLGESRGVVADVEMQYDRRHASAFVGRIAARIERDAVDAELEVHESSVSVSPSRVGYAVATKPNVDALMARLQGDTSPVRLAVHTIEPETTEAAYRQVLLLDQGDHELTLFQEGERVKSWIVATGTGEYPTPLGRYHITLKRYMPTWVNPAPDGWGKDLPREIAPGPGNPLGVRALNWDAPAIRFHGTQAVDTLGTDASHGCVRMSNADVTELYDLVDVGAVIISRT